MHLSRPLCWTVMVLVVYYGISRDRLGSRDTAVKQQNKLNNATKQAENEKFHLDLLSKPDVLVTSWFHLDAGPGRGRKDARPGHVTDCVAFLFLTPFLKTLVPSAEPDPVSAFQLIRLQKPAVYSAAVTTKRWGRSQARAAFRR